MISSEMIGDEDGHDLPQYGLLLSVVGGLVVAGPLFMADGGDKVLGAVKELFGPVGLRLLPVSLILLIRVLSSGHRLVNIFGFALGESLDTVHHVGRESPAGAALVLLIFLLVAYFWLFVGGGGD